MDKDYSRRELEKKKIAELKEILRSLKLPISGNKEELIGRILQTQIQPVTTSYFDVLPKDITRMVGKYRAKNEPNNKIVEEILDRILEEESPVINAPRNKFLRRLEKFNKFLIDNHIPFRVRYNEKKANLWEEAINNQPAYGSNMYQNWSRNILQPIIQEPTILIDILDEPVTEKQLIEVIAYILEKTRKRDYEIIGDVLDKYNSNIRVVVSTDNKYTIGRFQSLMTI